MTLRAVYFSCCFLLVFQANGQEVAPDSTIHTSISLDEVVISANKTPEKRRTVSQRIRLMESKEIAELQVQTTADVIAASGSVSVQKSQAGGGSPVIRGFEASRILLVIDGVRMNNLIFRSGHLQNIITLDHAILDRAEILFGPSSTVYGSDALGGVIHLYTRNPVLPDSGKHTGFRGFTRYSSANHERTGHLDASFGTRKFGSLTSLTYSVFDDLRGGANKNPFYDNSYGERPYFVERINGSDSLVSNPNRLNQVQSGYSQTGLLQKFLFKPTNHQQHILNLQYATSTDVPRYDRLTNPGPEGLQYAEWYYGPQKRTLAAYDLQLENADAKFQSVHAGVNIQHIEESRHTRKFKSNELTNRTEKVTVLGGNLDVQKLVKTHKVRMGLDFQHNMLNSTAFMEDINAGTTGKLDSRYPDGDNTMTNMAIYISHTWQIKHSLTLNDGFRIGYSRLKSTFVDTSFFVFPFSEAKQDNPVYSGSLGLIHSSSDKLKLSLLFASGFRVPNTDDLAKIFDSTTGQVIVPNPDLKPELTFNFEAGFETVLAKQTKLDGTVYYTVLRDAIVTDLFTFNGKDSIVYDGLLSRVMANQNKRSAYIYGFSSALNTNLSPVLSMALRANYVYGRIKTADGTDPLDHVSPFSIHWNIKYNRKKFTVRYFVNYNGWKRIKDFHPGGEDNQKYAPPEGMPAWFTLNLHLGYRLNKHVSLRTGIDNILDTQYRVFASGINGPGRNVFVAVSFSN